MGDVLTESLESEKSELVAMYERRLKSNKEIQNIFESLAASPADQDLRVLYLDDMNHYSESSMFPMSIKDVLEHLSKIEILYQNLIDDVSREGDPSRIEQLLDSEGAHGGSTFYLESDPSIGIPSNPYVDVYGEGRGESFEDLWAAQSKTLKGADT